jgi:hypothetical protein
MMMFFSSSSGRRTKTELDPRISAVACFNELFFCFQDVVYALAHATGKTGRFTLIERWRNNERLLAPQENPLKVRD